MIKQQLCSSGGLGPSCTHTTVHIPIGAKRQICHCSFFRCSQTPQTCPLSWENTTGPALCSRRTTTNAHRKNRILKRQLSRSCFQANVVCDEFEQKMGGNVNSILPWKCWKRSLRWPSDEMLQWKPEWCWTLHSSSPWALLPPAGYKSALPQTCSRTTVF